MILFCLKLIVVTGLLFAWLVLFLHLFIYFVKILDNA